MKRIFELLQARNITQYTLAKEIGVSTGNISDWKSGRAAPKADALIKIADYFNVSVDYLLGRTETAGYSETAKAPPEQDGELLELFHLLNASGQTKVLGYAEDLVSSGNYSKNSADKLA